MGFAAGFQVGAQAVERGFKMREEDELKRGLAKAYAKPETFQGYTAEQGQQLEELAKTGAYDIVPQYGPAAEGQTQGLFMGYQAVPKAGLDLQGDTPAAPMTFNQQQVQEYGGRRVAGQFNPTELRGLQMEEAARVLASSGDIKGALAMQAQAEEQAYQAKYRPLQLKQLEGSIAGQEQQRELTGLQLTEGKRTAEQRQNQDNFLAFAAENPNATVAELKNAALTQFKLTPKQWQENVATRLQIETGEMDIFKNSIKKKLQGKNLTQLGSLYNSDPDFDDKTDLTIVPGKNGAVTLNFIDKATKTVTSTQTFRNEALATEYLNKQATEPETIGSWMISLREKEASIAAKEASADKDKGLSKLYAQGGAGAGKGTLKQKVADFKEVYGRDPTEAEKAILAGIANKPREFSQSDVTSRAKFLIESGMTDPDDPKKPLSPQKAIQMATAELSGAAYVSPVDQLIAEIAKAREAGKPPAPGPTPPAAAPAPAARGIDTSRPNPSINPVTGLPRAAPAFTAPNIPQAISAGLDAAQANYVTYLQGKIAANKPLTPDEAMRAKRYGLQ